MRLPFRVRDLKAEDTFILSMISEYAILGTPFLMAHQYCMDFKRPIIYVDGKELKCVDRHGLLRESNFKVVRGVVVPCVLKLIYSAG